MPSAISVIGRTVISSTGTTTISFSSIPQTFTDLILVWTGSLVSGTASLALSINGSTAGSAGYCLAGNGTNFSAFNTSNTLNPRANAQSSYTNMAEINIFRYSSTTLNKAIHYRTGQRFSESTLMTNNLVSTAAITSLGLVLGASSFQVGSTVTLFGVVS